MPVIKSAIKRMHQTLKRRARNVTAKRNLRTALKSFAGDKTTASLSKTQSELDKAVKKNLLSKNAAARKKTQLARQAKEAGVKTNTAKKTTKAPTKPAAKKTTTKKVSAAKKTSSTKKAE